MKNQSGLTLIEVMIMAVIMCILLAAALTLFKGKADNTTKQEVRNAELNYNDYTKKCIKGQTYMVSKNGDIRQLLTEHKETIVCDVQNEPTTNIEVNANPYNNTQ